MKLIDTTGKTNWKYIAIVGVLGLVVGGGILLLKTLGTPGGGLPFSNECRQIEQEIDVLIQQATYCEVDSDCVVPSSLLPGKPPCACLYAANENYTVSSELKNVSQRWYADCQKGIVCEACAPPPQFVRCEQNQCVGVWSQDNSTINTSTWQTYRNDEFGFEVRYPRDWDITEIQSEEDYGSIVSLYPKKNQGEISESADPEISIAIAYRALEQERAKRKISGIKFNYSNTFISGRVGYISAVLPGVHGEVKEILIDAGNDRTFIIFTQNAIDIFDQILSTFRFGE